jgi:hypothetical protein
MESHEIGIHEIIDLREINAFKVACLAEAKGRVDRVEDPDLRELVEENIRLGTATVSHIRDILSRAQTKIDQ